MSTKFEDLTTSNEHWMDDPDYDVADDSESTTNRLTAILLVAGVIIIAFLIVNKYFNPKPPIVYFPQPIINVAQPQAGIGCEIPHSKEITVTKEKTVTYAGLMTVPFGVSIICIQVDTIKKTITPNPTSACKEVFYSKVQDH